MAFKRDSLYVLAVQLANVVGGGIAGILVARTLGAEGKGAIHLVFLVPLFVASMGGLATRASAVYFTGQGASRRHLLVTILVIASVLSVAYVLAGLLFKGPLGEVVLKGLEPRWVVLAIGLIPVYLFWTFCEGMLHGMLRFGAYAAIQLVSLGLKLVLLVTFLVFLDKGIAAAMAVYAIASVVPAIATLAVVVAHASGGTRTVSVSEVLGYGLRVYWGTAAQRANVSADPFIMNPFVGPAAVGVYSVSFMLAGLAQQVPGALSQALLPRVASAKPDEAARITCRVARQTVFVALLPGAVLALLAPWLVPFVFGEEFREAVLPFWVLLPGAVALAFGQVLSQYLAGSGKPTLNSVASAGALGIHIALMFLLIPRYGILGAALASTVAYLSRTVAVAAFFSRDTGLPIARAIVPLRSDIEDYRALAGQIVARARGRAQ